MGVRGLLTFINGNEDLFTYPHPLRDTQLVIDGFNLMNRLAQLSDAEKRTDLFGGDTVKFGKTLNSFYDNLEACNIVPILVMDGAQTFEVSKSKVEQKLKRNEEKFQDIMNLHLQGLDASPPHIFPPHGNIVFKSVAVDRGVRIYQGFFEADMEAARLARELKCPVLSDDSDFFLTDVPGGIIPISGFEWSNPRKPASGQGLYITCKLYKRENFRNYLPNFDVDCLPLLGPLMGNDFVGQETYSSLCARLPPRYTYSCMSKQLQTRSRQHGKIADLLCFFSGKTLPQLIDQFSSALPEDKRSQFKQTIASSIDVYSPTEDTYVAELRQIYKDGFKRTYAKYFSQSELDSKCDKAIRKLARWLRDCAEKSVMTHGVLQSLNNNVIFSRPLMDDLGLESAHHCHYRVFSVIARLLRPDEGSTKITETYDRIGSRYLKTSRHHIDTLEKFGPISYLAYDVPKLPGDKRRDLFLATFHHDLESFDKGLLECGPWFDADHGDEFMTVSMILDYIDIENPDGKLWKEFRQATLLCLVFYLCIEQTDDNFSARLEQEDNLEFTSGFKASIRSNSLDELPDLGNTRLFGIRTYDCRIMHQISQLNLSLEAFNLLNSFLGDPLSRVRAEYWLNSCLIYNLTDALRKGVLKVPRMPDIIADGATCYSA